MAELLKKTSLILWDEAPMANKHCFEALDKSLRDILRFTNENSDEKPFGGMTIILGGDFRQILPVITKVRREQIVNATIKRSYLWKHFEIFELTQNMRLKCLSDDPIQKQKVAEFAEWILQIGDGKTTSDEGEDWIKIPKDLLLEKGENRKEQIVKSIYPNLLQKYRERDYLEERAILCPRNDTVKEINDHIMSQIQGEEVTYLSLDTVCKATTNTNIMMNMQPTEFLNTLTSPGIPDHKLKLKVGLPLMLLESSCHQVTQNGHSCFFIWQWISTLLNITSSPSYHILPEDHDTNSNPSNE